MAPFDASPFNRRRFLGTASALGAAGMLAACGKEPAAPTPAASAPAPAASTDTKKYAGQSLNLLFNQPHAVAGKLLAEDFEALTGAKINITPVPYDQLHAQATLDVQSGANQFDVIDYFYHTLGALVSDKVVVDVTDWIARDQAQIEPADFLPSLYDTYTLRNGRRWGLPYDGDTHVLFYNTEIFARHQLSAPKTWEDYYQAAKLITQKESANGIYGAAVQGFKIPVIVGSSYANRLAGFGGSFFTADGKPALTSPEAIAAAEELLRIVPYALPTPAETAFEHALPAFLSGKAAMIDFWTDLGVTAQDPQSSQIVDKWALVALPVGGKNTTPRAALNAGFGLGITTGTKKTELAWEFIKWATSKDVSLKQDVLPGSGIDPNRSSVLNSPVYGKAAPALQAEIQATIGSALAWPLQAQSPQLMDALTEQLALIVSGKKKPRDALAAAQARWEQLLSA
ncbi:multiple sugar transport system substrate-binding protein [Rhodoferax sp. OV413]|uniref:ABC transporter substrate-binding protein n=1 Tax=Rhodoferax sp. OV413 TaxID=1855285 RepID=UPI00088CCED2|nr:sugar ABC transporter substrate-binding protein [Rhodoferax sp. OV413]SDP54432.1 multiple sugar transport system substrate-binding protein [Rhodoferax sp. OV413]